MILPNKNFFGIKILIGNLNFMIKIIIILIISHICIMKIIKFL